MPVNRIPVSVSPALSPFWNVESTPLWDRERRVHDVHYEQFQTMSACR